MKRFWLQSLSITLFSFFMLWGANAVTDLKLFTAFDTIGQALKDFELTDYAFSMLREDPTVDPRIIVVNIGNLSRRDIAQQIALINQYKPKVIAIDSYFDCEGGLRDSINCPALLDPIGNLLLSNAIQEAGNVVLVSKLLQTDSLSKSNAIDGYDSIEYSDPEFSKVAKNGFANLVTEAVFQDDIKLCRKFVPRWEVNGETQYAFAVQTCFQYDSAKTLKFLARQNEEEIVNYRGNVEIQDIKLKNVRQKETATTKYPVMFYAIDVDQLQKGEVAGEILKDNIVVMGFLGERFGDMTWSDKYFTPLNKTIAGRANPDMFGVIVHANIIAMILNEDYIDELPGWGNYLIAFLVCLLTVALFIWIDRILPQWFDAMSVIIQLFEVLLISLFIIQAFAWWSLKLDLSVAIGISALVGPAYDIFKSVQNEIDRRLTKRREKVSTT